MLLSCKQSQSSTSIPLFPMFRQCSRGGSVVVGERARGRGKWGDVISKGGGQELSLFFFTFQLICPAEDYTFTMIFPSIMARQRLLLGQAIFPQEWYLYWRVTFYVCFIFSLFFRLLWDSGLWHSAYIVILYLHSTAPRSAVTLLLESRLFFLWNMAGKGFYETKTHKLTHEWTWSWT